MEELSQIESLVEYVVKTIVKDKDAVKISTTKDGDFNIISVSVADVDVGKVIGRHGKTAQSIRTIVYSFNRTGQRVTVKFGNND